jgi:hypothetical protein
MTTLVTTRSRGTAVLAATLLALTFTVSALAQNGKRPNIVVIWGDDIGRSNLSVFTKGMMGYQTPNIDRIAHEGMLFTDFYADQSCTAGRSSFITGQSVFRTGLSKVGMPAAKTGLSAEDPTIATLLKAQGYSTGHFGKNHLGDRNEYLPTMHGFDEFYGNLYHLNAEEEPEQPDYPTDPEFRRKYGPRGVLDCKATNVDDPTVDPRNGKVGKIADRSVRSKRRRKGLELAKSLAVSHLRQSLILDGVQGCPQESPPASCERIPGKS